MRGLKALPRPWGSVDLVSLESVMSAALPILLLGLRPEGSLSKGCLANGFLPLYDGLDVYVLHRLRA